MYKCNVLGIFLLFSCTILSPADITFPVHSYAASKLRSDSFILGALNKGAKDYALSAVDHETIVPLADEKVIISDFDVDVEELTKQVPNPLFDQPISHVAVFANNSRIIAASPSFPASLYLVEKKSSGVPELLVCNDIKDSEETIISEITALTGSDTTYVFAAVKVAKNQEDLTSFSHEIALLQFQQKQQENKSVRFAFKQISCNPLTFAKTEKEKILLIDSTIVDMWWDSALKMLYVLVRNHESSEGLYGHYTILGGAIEEDSLVFKTVMPYFVKDHDFSLNSLINNATKLSKVRTLYTSTKLSYMLLLEGGASSQRLFAVPVCDMNYKKDQKELHGTIAKSESSVSSLFLVNNRLPAIQGRYFESPILNIEDLRDLKSPSMLIGGGILKEGHISDIFVEGDSVYATVADATQNSLPGLFVSQPIFDHRGAIVNWTSWQRVAGITKPLSSATFNYKTGNFNFLLNSAGNACVQGTSWSTGKKDGFKPVADALKEYFSAAQGGIHGCFDFNYKNPAVSYLSMMVCTGYKKIALIQTGSLGLDSFQMTRHEGEKYINNSGSFQADMQEKLALISGGALDSLDMITSAELVENGKQGFLCLGGVKGLVILMHDNGSGWDIMPSNNDLPSLVRDMSFKKIGTYRFIRKLIYDRGYLYVLTDTLLDRIDIAASNFITNDLKVTTLALAREFQGNISCSFTDCVISEKLAFLGTNKGLWRSANGVDSAHVLSKEAMQWVYQPLLDGSDNIIQLRTVTASHQERDCARGNGSMVYVLNGYYGHSVTYVHRFALLDTEKSQVADYTVLPIPDYKLFQRFPYYHRYVGFKNQLGIDGAYCLTGQNCNRSADYSDNPVLGLTPAQGVGIHAPLLFSEQDEIISTIVHNSTSGSWIVTGDFGLRLNE